MNFEALSSNPITAKKNKVACFLGQAGYGVTPSPFTADSTFYPVPHARAYTRRAMTMFSSSLKGGGGKARNKNDYNTNYNTEQNPLGKAW
jgi:hypothetical protein